MCNNVSKILKLIETTKEDAKQNQFKQNSTISVGDKVFIRSLKKESRVVSIKHGVGLYECESNILDGWFERSDLDKI